MMMMITIIIIIIIIIIITHYSTENVGGERCSWLRHKMGGPGFDSGEYLEIFK